MNNALHAVFKDTIQDMYNSETQITAALPKMQEAAQNSDLKQAISDHLAETREHVRRLEEVCSILGFETGNVTCQATAGLIREAKEQMEKFGKGPGGDAAIIACAQTVEHYEICRYGTVIEWAEEMEHDKDAIKLLKETLKEESAANEKLNKIATHQVNEEALNAQPVSTGGARLI